MVIKKFGWLILFFCLLYPSRSALAEMPSVDYIDGSLDRVYETKSGGWTAFVLVRDSLRKSFKCFVDPQQTLIRKGSQILSLSQLNPGTKVIVLARKEDSGDYKASVIQVKDPVLR